MSKNINLLPRSRNINLLPRSRNFNLLPHEMQTEIFTRLPPKSLGICKCVSKSWKSLISDPTFIETHASKTSVTKLMMISSTPNWGSLLSVTRDGVASRLVTSESLKNKWSKMWGSCNGLVLLENNLGTRFLLNPATLMYKRLPTQDGGSIFGLGYDKVSDDYVVVALTFHPCFKGHAHSFVYTLKADRWMSAESSPYDHTLIKPAPGILFKGYLHWVAKDVKTDLLLIAAFNVVNKKFSTVPIPKEVSDLKLDVRNIRVFKGSLCLQVNVYNCKTELWVMKDYGVADSWTKLPVHLSEGSCLVSTHLAEDSLVVNGRQFALLVSSGKELTLQPMEARGLPSKFLIGMTYVESLVSPR